MIADRAFIDMNFAPLTMDQAASEIAGRDATAPFAYVVTPNVDHLVRLDRERNRLQPFYDAAWLRLCDSRILARLARHYGIVLPVVTGSDLTATLLRQVVRPGDRICVIGGEKQLPELLGAACPGVSIVQHIPPMGLARNEAALDAAADFIAAARARFTFLAVGSPQQEILAYRTVQRGDATGLGLCIGASLDFLTGKVERAPLWMRRAGLEWAHRLLSEPKRMWRRYLVEGPRIFVIAHRWAKRQR